MHTQIWIVDFGSQYTQLIARKTRQLGYSSKIYTYKEAIENFKKNLHPSALVLSGGPQSVFDDDSDFGLFFEEKKLPILGVCYGMQIIANYFNGVVEKGVLGEYGKTKICFQKQEIDSLKLPEKFDVWMSHFDHVTKVPSNFSTIFKSEHNLIAGIMSNTQPIWGLQFHPEVDHSEYGNDLLQHFFKNVAKISPNWNGKTMMEEALSCLNKVSKENVLCAFSGGVESLVAASIAIKKLGERLFCIFVDNGLLRIQDYDHIKLLQKSTHLRIDIIDAKELFLSKLKGLSDPEKKRKIIGKTFIDVFEQEVERLEKKHKIKFEYLLQGTLYPDVIESISPHKKNGKSVTIKSHHNVGGLPENLKLKLLEPLRYLFKDEVRVLGEQLGLKYEWVHRHPFPGPGLGVRILGEISKVGINCVQKSDQILFEEMNNFRLYHSIWQAFTVFLPIKTVGVKGDGRAFEYVICLRLVDSTDGMSATWCDVPREFLIKVSSRITNEVEHITRVVYDITSKPPGTIEWE